MNLEATLQRLCAIPAVSGFEPGAADAIHALFSPYCSEFQSTPLGSHIGIRRCGRAGAPLLLIDGHLDQIGGRVTRIADGFVWFTGNFDRRALVGKELVIHGTEPLRAIAGTKESDTGKLGEFEDFFLDTGCDPQTVEALVRPGDQITYAPAFTRLSGGYVCAPSLDDRAAIAAGLYALSLLQTETIGIDVALCASAGEEVGGAGARTAAFTLHPDYAVAIDVTFSAQPGADGEEMLRDDAGVTIARGPHMNRALTARLFALAQREKIPHGIEVEAGNTGTNTSSIRLAGDGVACALLGLPLRSMHTCAECIRLSNIEAAGRLLAALIRDLGEA